jgi:ribosomal protein S18 acetylase RimI-like enzyme
MSVEVREYAPADLPAMIRIWNEVVDDAVAFPQTEGLDEKSGAAFFAAQTRCGVAVRDGVVVGLYILHPNNIGRCGHIANASYAVERSCRGGGVGRALVTDCLARGREAGFGILQFNAVVASNVYARKLYESLGFHELGIVPGGFRLRDGSYADICLYYIEL